mgnify:CR=1 FL=1
MSKHIYTKHRINGTGGAYLLVFTWPNGDFEIEAHPRGIVSLRPKGKARLHAVMEAAKEGK